ncbi:MAG: hypothetical protein AAFQ63_14965 [Cyanobacteria bacterium J06621_11]
MKLTVYALGLFLFLCGCAAQSLEPQYTEQVSTKSERSVKESEAPGVIAVEMLSGAADDYTFSVTIQSPDEGCDRYANWWEVITEDGTLLYRRILAHSHVDEQPFTRSGGPVAIEADDLVIVRSHMHPTGYHTQAMKGTFTDGFESVTLPAEFAIELSESSPIPTGCSF